MTIKSKVCLTTYIYGRQYQSYIPFLLHSCFKAYPKYDVILFLYDKLDSAVRESIKKLNLTNNVIINENVFKDCPNMNPQKSQCFRWIIWDDTFMNYDYLYTIDIDIFYIREPIPLHEQHVQHMKYLGLPISNLRRIVKSNPLNLNVLHNRLKHARLKSFFKFITRTKTETRLTGLHFVDVKRYYSLLNPDIRNQFKKDIYTGNYVSYVMNPNDEILLAQIVESLGVDILKFGVQKNPTTMLDFNNTGRKEFRPHHGVHLGIFRSSQSVKSSESILKSDAYFFYLNFFKENVINDKIFLNILDNAPENIKSSFDTFFNYYDINL